MILKCILVISVKLFTCQQVAKWGFKRLHANQIISSTLQPHVFIITLLQIIK